MRYSAAPYVGGAMFLLVACTLQPHDSVAEVPPEASADSGEQWQEYQGLGTEPFWNIGFDDGTINFEQLDYVQFSAQLTEPEVIPNGHRFVVPATITPQYGPPPFDTDVTIDVTGEVCGDGMSDQTFPDTVTVSYTDMVFRGCGGDPADLLTGDEWTVTRIGDVPVSNDPPVTIAFFSDGNVSGSGGCNRFTSTYSLDQGLSFGPIASTRRACPEPIGGIESEFFTALENTIYFNIWPDGTLLIHTEDGSAAFAAQR